METRRPTHPTAEVLKAFGLGKLDDSSSGALMAHLDLCADCRKIMASQSGDDFLDRLRQAYSRSATPAPVQTLGGNEGKPKPPPGPTTLFNLPPELAGNPQYDILRELGRGGMGVVYLAKNKLMDRLEVLKVINKTLLDRPGAVERFLREIRSAAKLNHVNVVAAYSALQLSDLLVFAMEYVEGQDLAAVVKANGPLPIPHACFYVQQAAQGLQHAFEKKMVHRDIKPQNLILAREGRKHLVKVLDFGLAKMMRENPDDTGLTGEGKMLGTPDYMAPEQTLDATSADIRADIYSLGCTLYFLLSGNRPFKCKNLFDIMQAHQSLEAPALNLARPEVPEELAAVVRKMMAKDRAMRYQTPLEVVQALKPFIRQVASSQSSPGLSVAEAKAAGVPVAKAVSLSLPSASAKQPPALPATPPAVAWDSLTDSVIASAQSGKSGVDRKRRWLLAGGLTTGLLLLGLLGYWLAVVLLRVETPNGTLVVEMNGDAVEARIRKGKLILTGPDGKVRYTLTANDRSNKLEAGAYKIRVEGADGLVLDTPEFTLKNGGQVKVRVAMAERAVGNDAPAGVATDPKPTQHALDSLKRDKIPIEALALAGDGDPKQAPASLVGVLGEAQPIHSQAVLGLAYSPDGRWLASASADKTILLRDTATGDVKRILQGHTEAVSAVAFSKDSRTLLSASHDGSLRLWSVDKEENPLVVDTKLGPRMFPALAVSPERRFVAAGGESGLIKLWKWGAWEKATDFTALSGKVKLRALTLSPDGKLLACGGEKEENEKSARVRIYAVADGSLEKNLLCSFEAVRALSFSHDGKHLAAVGAVGNGAVWEAASGKQVAVLARHYLPGEWPNSFSVAWSPDDKTIVVGGYSQVVVHDALTGNRCFVRWDITDVVFGPHQIGVNAVAFSAKGNLLAAGGHYGDVPVWETTSWKRKYLERGHRHYVGSVATNPNGEEAVSLGDESALLRWQLACPRLPMVRHLEFAKVAPMALHKSTVFYSQDGKTNVFTWWTGIAVRNTVTEKETVMPTGNGPLGLPSLGETPAISSDGRTAAFSTADDDLHLWDLARGRQVHRFPTKGWCSGLAFSRDGKLLASFNVGARRGTIWNVGTGAEGCSWEVKSYVRVSAFHPHGKTLATGHEDGAILLWDTATGQKRIVLGGHSA